MLPGMEAKPDYVVVGAGPAGAAFAYYASSKGYRVHVYDQYLPGRKPCGWAVPSLVEKYLRIPSEAVLVEIKGYRVYLDGDLLFEERRPGWGWIVDKPRLLEALLEGVERVVYRKPVRLPYSGPPRLPGGDGVLEAREAVVYAPGHAWPYSPGEKINAVQELYQVPSGLLEPGVVEVWFDSGMVGYYWVFPRSERLVDIGVGGYLGFNELQSRLRSFAVERLEGRGVLAESTRGARIVVEGVDYRLFNRREYPVIGEAAGFVLPISGEGIRPSIASAHALYASMERGEDRVKLVKEIAEWVKRQRRLLEAIKRGSPRTRAAVLRALPPRVMIGIGLGTLTMGDILKASLRAPASVAKILKYMVSQG